MSRTPLRRRIARTAVAALGLTTIAVVTAGQLSHAAPATAANGVPTYDHVVIVMDENHQQSQIIGSASAPYITSLANGGAQFPNSFAITHPSEPNYLAFFSGSTQGVTNDACPLSFGGDNLGHQLIASGKTFVGYSEGLPSAGSLTCSSGRYARKHAPWTNFTDLNQASVNLPFTSFPSSANYDSLPTVSWIVPDLCNDMHDCSVSTGDTWLKNNVDAYAQWARTHNSLLIFTFDEDDSAGNNRIATIFYGAGVKTGTYTETINHYTVLRTLEDMYALPALGSAASASPITDVWGAGSTGNTVTVTNPGSQSTTVNTAVSLQVVAADSATGQTLTYAASGLPAGLTINTANGLISGTPSIVGSSSVTVTATDTTGASGSTTFTWAVRKKRH
jgi:phosphatidylinositol-3-phosphatase